ncbi:proline iminopeptidase-family hydrolase [Lactobacillus sp. Sy-1]|uniref:proline iminopeptidase-family hydrolase n=1 Tax=Lactobacillus sp. Sy-1 TaxID=2109645 RepID=UPI001C5B189D|nr:proline iminopeptidase-family hydrolase [Lactobacillus sp. Sy-1]MBW1606105.1 proline iminopeptidase-family hydrolase [Lactobacillus sp. Sy-1]
MEAQNRFLQLDNGYHLWTRQVGSGNVKILALHGGPGSNHEVWEDAHEQLKKYGLEAQVVMYDQLGSWYSETPDFKAPTVASRFLNYDYFLNEVEEVRQKLGWDDFYLMGHSWGGLLTQLYAAKFGEHLKGVVIASMVDDIDDYTDNLDRILKQELSDDDYQFMKACEQQNDFHNQRYQDFVEKLNQGYVMRTQPAKIAHLVDTTNKDVYNAFQGDNEFVITGILKDWHFGSHLSEIKRPTLITFGEHETMPVAVGKRMAQRMPNAKFVSSPNAGHCHMVDNAPAYYQHLVEFINEVESGQFNH